MKLAIVDGATRDVIIQMKKKVKLQSVTKGKQIERFDPEYAP
jgi:hypothetical protein